jgi:hypothetical protein
MSKHLTRRLAELESESIAKLAAYPRLWELTDKDLLRSDAEQGGDDGD